MIRRDIREKIKNPPSSPLMSLNFISVMLSFSTIRHNIKKDEILTLKINGIEISLPTEENNEFGGILLPYFDSKIPANEIFADSRFCDFEIVKGGENE